LFSTGDKLDDLYVSGDVRDALSIKKASENKFVVGLYQVKDTINYRQKPYYITKVDDDGYFELNYLAAGKYKIIALKMKTEIPSTMREKKSRISERSCCRRKIGFRIKS
jgi:hypothetical protein